MTFNEEVELLVRSGHPGLVVKSHEERRCLLALEAVAKRLKWSLWSWSATTGWTSNGKVIPAGGSSEALVELRKLPDESICVLRDFHSYIDSAFTVRLLRDILTELRTRTRILDAPTEGFNRVIVFLSPALHIPLDLEKDLSEVAFPLPDRGALHEALDTVVQSSKVKVTIDSESAMIESCLGLTQVEAENSYSLAHLAFKGKFGPGAVALIQKQKAAVIRKSGLLEYFPPEGSLDDVGGCELLLDWLLDIGKVMGRYEEALVYGFRVEDVARGVLLIGCPGTGKSLISRRMAASWGWPLYGLNVGKLTGSLHGETEAKTSRALELAEAGAPGILRIDEGDKQFAGLNSSGQTDSGVTSRQIGSIVTWFEEHRAQLFVCMTANRPWAIPAELFNRFEDCFHVDLPNLVERVDILTILLRQRKQTPESFALDDLAKATHEYNGRELRKIVRAGMRASFLRKEPLSMDALLLAAEQIKPIGQIMRKEVDEIRKWCSERHVRSASADLSNGSSAGRRLM